MLARSSNMFVPSVLLPSCLVWPSVFFTLDALLCLHCSHSFALYLPSIPSSLKSPRPVCSFTIKFFKFQLNGEKLGISQVLQIQTIDPLSAFSFFLILFFHFNWRLITLQYCSGFCHTWTWISHGCACVPPFWTPPTFLYTPSLWVAPEHWLWVPFFMHGSCTGNLFCVW